MSLPDVWAPLASAKYLVCEPKQVIALLETSTVGTLIVDPCVFRSDLFDVLRREIEPAPTRIVVLAKASACTTNRILGMIMGRLTDILLVEALGSHMKLASVLNGPGEPSIMVELLLSLRHQIAHLRLALRHPLIALFCGAPILHTVKELAAVAGVSRRTLEREVHYAGILSSADLLSCLHLGK